MFRKLLRNSAFTAIGLSGFGLLGCASGAGNGALIGGAGGAGLGAIVGHNSHGNTAGGALVGGAIGAVTGAIVGNEVDRQQAREDDRPRRRYYNGEDYGPYAYPPPPPPVYGPPPGYYEYRVYRYRY